VRETAKTYEECWEDNGIFQPGTRQYSLCLACAPNPIYGYVRVAPDSTNPTKIVIDRIPATINPATVAQHLRSLAFWPAPARIDWTVAATLPPRSILLLKRVPSLDERGPEWDETHYRALRLPDDRCVGWTA
jgi:hypothetical protein